MSASIWMVCLTRIIALIKVNRPIKMSDTVTGICLPGAQFEEPMTASLIAVGWGSTQYQDNDLPVHLQE